MYFLLAPSLLRTITRKQLTQIHDSAPTGNGNAVFLFCIYTHGVKYLAKPTSKSQRSVHALRAEQEGRRGYTNHLNKII